MFRTIRVRLFPTKEQEQLFYQYSGACRFIYNKFLEWTINNYNQSKGFLRKSDFLSQKKLYDNMMNLRNTKDYEWLKDITLHTLERVQRDFKEACERYLYYQKRDGIQYKPSVLRRCAKENRKPLIQERKWHPQFKKRKDDDWSFPSGVGQGETYFNYINGKLMVHLPKIGWMKFRSNQNIPVGDYKSGPKLLKNPRIKLINSKWILSVAIKFENQEVSLHNDKVIGIDVGLKILAAVTHCSEDDDVKIFKNINKRKEMKRYDRRLKKAQRMFSHKEFIGRELAKKNNTKYQRSKRANKLQKKLRAQYRRLHNIRVNYLHHVTGEIVDQKSRAIVIEDFSLKFMLKNHKQAKSASEQMLGTFRRQLQYKCAEYNIQLIEADRWYPSSRLCSHCGSYKSITLKERTYVCEKCGAIIDRDINAAINLEHYGIYKHIAFILNDSNKAM